MGPNDQGYFPDWRLNTEGDIMPDERMPPAQMLIVGVQHVVAMFGATVLVPLLIGFDPNVAIFFSGIATLIFFVVVGGRVPSYLGSSFAFIAVVGAVTGHAIGSPGANANIGLALGGIIACGALYAIIGVIVTRIGHEWVEHLMPPVVTGAVVAVIGLNLAPIAVRGISATGFATWMGLITVVSVGLAAVLFHGLAQRLPILIGGAAAYVIYYIAANIMSLGPPIDFSGVANAAWFGWPNFTTPVFSWQAIFTIAPVAVILVAENLGHIKGIGLMTGRNMDPYIGRGFIGDGIATMVAGSGGAAGMTTYAENMGVMAVTKIYSTLVFVIAGVVAIALGFSPKFGALIRTIPGPVLGGLSIVLFGLIAALAGRIWVGNKVDFADSRNLITVGVTLVAGAGDLTLNFFGFTLGGLGVATFGGILFYHLLGRATR